MVRIPQEYQEVEYLESTDGTGQYIDTGIVLTDLTSVKVRFNLPSKTSYGSAFGSRYNSFCISRVQNHEYFVAQIYGSSTSLSNFRYTQNEWVDAELHMTQCVLNGTVYEIRRGTTVTSYPIWMFGKSKSSAAALDVKNACKISYLQIYEDDYMVANFIPCYRKSDNEIGMYDTVSKTFFTNQGTGTFLKGNDVNYDTVNLMESRRRILLNTPHLESLTGSILSFNTDMASNLKECKIYFTPIQEGTGDPSPDNVRPIHGWDGIEVTRCGKNLLNPDDENWGQYTITPTGEHISETDRICTDYIPCNEGETYTFSGTVKGSNNYVLSFAGIAGFDENKEYVGRNAVNYVRKLSYTVPSGVKYIRAFEEAPKYPNITMKVWCNTLKRQLELSSTATDYEPYQGQSITIPFPQTIYGGYVDLVNGEVVEEWDSEGQEITPNTYSITLQTIRTLKGLNNIFSDANGNIEIKYWTH